MLLYIASPKLEMEEETLSVPRYGVSDVRRIYGDLLRLDSDRRREHLQEIVRQSDNEYSVLMDSCPKDLLEAQKKSLFETLSFISNNRSERGNNLLHYAAYDNRFDIFWM